MEKWFCAMPLLPRPPPFPTPGMFFHLGGEGGGGGGKVAWHSFFHLGGGGGGGGGRGGMAQNHFSDRTLFFLSSI